MQRNFLKKIIELVEAPSLRELAIRIDINYSTLKNYFNEERFFSETFFKDLCYVAKINRSFFNIKYLDKNWGQIKGGRNNKIKNGPAKN